MADGPVDADRRSDLPARRLGVDKRFGTAGAGGAMGIVVGSVVDGVPESGIFGIQIGTGVEISIGFLVAVFVSNIPQAIAPSADLAASGWGVKKLGTL
jgi:zinc transporter, ZIP family